MPAQLLSKRLTLPGRPRIGMIAPDTPYNYVRLSKSALTSLSRGVLSRQVIPTIGDVSPGRKPSPRPRSWFTGDPAV